MAFSGKTITITGAASGIGLATAKLLASKGAKVSISDIQEEALHQVEEEIKNTGGNVISAVVDVRNRVQVEDWIKKTVETFGKLDGAANIAGVLGGEKRFRPIHEIDDDEWDFVIGINQKGVLNCLRAQIPHMNDGGSIVNASSLAGIMGTAGNAVYAASKHAVVGITRCAAKELGPRKIRCNCLAPGPIDTPMMKDHGLTTASGEEFKFPIALGLAGKPEDVANLTEWLLSDGSSFITGTAQVIDGGWDR